MRNMNEPQRAVILITDWNVNQLALILSNTNNKMASKFVRTRAPLQEMAISKEV